MHARFLTAVAFSAAVMAGAVGPAAATDTGSLSAFLGSCPNDTKGCKGFTRDTVLSARNANYGCIPKSLSDDDAADALLAWLKGPASANAKYEKMSLEDVMWEGVDHLWPCKGK